MRMNGVTGWTGWPLNLPSVTCWLQWPLLYVDVWARWITWSSSLQTGYRITQKKKIQFLLTLVTHFPSMLCPPSVKTAISTGRAPGLELREPSRTEKLSAWCHQILTTRTRRDLSTCPIPPNGVEMFWPLRCVTDLKQTKPNISFEDKWSDCINEVYVNDCM